MNSTVFPTFQTQYILHFSSASRSGTRDLPNTEIFQSKDVATVYHNDWWILTQFKIMIDKSHVKRKFRKNKQNLKGYSTALT
jgi:hypothetical protein